MREYLTLLQPKLDARDRYFALCCVYLLEIVDREIKADLSSAGDNKGLFDELLDDVVGTSTREKMKRICEDIREGQFDHDLNRLHRQVFEHVVGKVQISNPDEIEN